jgi:hypothetical protein
MSLTQVQVISNALTLMGKKPINSISDKIDDITNAALQAYNFLLPSVISKAPWRFATQVVELSQLVTAPVITQWAFSYALPGDFLKMIRQYPQNYAYEIYAGNIMYSNINGPLYIEYVFLPEQTAFPDYFNHYFVYELAAYLSLSNAQSPQFYQPLAQERDFLRAVAMAADAQNRPQSPIASAPMIQNRYVTTGISG